MTEDDYRRAKNIARRACATQWAHLSREDREEVEQDAALTMWRTGSTTRTWWAAVDSATDHQQGRRVHRPTFVPLTMDRAATGDVEAEVVGRVMVEQLLACLPPAQRDAVEAIDVDGLAWYDAVAALDLPESTFAYRRRKGLERLRALVST